MRLVGEGGGGELGAVRAILLSVRHMSYINWGNWGRVLKWRDHLASIAGHGLGLEGKGHGFFQFCHFFIGGNRSRLLLYTAIHSHCA